MLRFVTFFCLAIILSGCGEKITEAHFTKTSGAANIIVGYGKGDLHRASNNAWKDARNKLDISGLGDYYGLAEASTKYQYNTAFIVFTLVPLKEIESGEHDSDSEELPEKVPPSI